MRRTDAAKRPSPSASGSSRPADRGAARNIMREQA